MEEVNGEKFLVYVNNVGTQKLLMVEHAASGQRVMPAEPVVGERDIHEMIKENAAIAKELLELKR